MQLNLSAIWTIYICWDSFVYQKNQVWKKANFRTIFFWFLTGRFSLSYRNLHSFFYFRNELFKSCKETCMSKNECFFFWSYKFLFGIQKNKKVCEMSRIQNYNLFFNRYFYISSNLWSKSILWFLNLRTKVLKFNSR